MSTWEIIFPFRAGLAENRRDRPWIKGPSDDSLALVAAESDEFTL